MRSERRGSLSSTPLTVGTGVGTGGLVPSRVPLPPAMFRRNGLSVIGLLPKAAGFIRSLGSTLGGPMAFSSILLRCLARAAVKNVANLLTFGVGGDLLTDVWDAWSRSQDKAGRKAEIEHLAAASPAEVRAAAAQAVLQEDPTLQPVLREQLVQWLTQTPAAIRRSLRRPSDPSGRTLAPGLTPACPGDLAGLLPPRPPRFRQGDHPPGLGDWQLEELLGVGGFGEVWKASNPYFPRPVALKFCLDPDAARSLRNEAALL